MMVLPFELIQSLESENCVLFIGSGVGRHLFRPDGTCLPTGDGLARELAAEFSIETNGDYDLATIAELVEIDFGRDKLISFLQKEMSSVEPDSCFKWLFTLTWKAVYTTNYDPGIENAYKLNTNCKQNPIPICRAEDFTRWTPIIDVPIIHLHGSVVGDGSSSIVITDDDYNRYKECRGMLFRLLQVDFASSSILYIGYANQDRDWKMLLREVTSEFEPSPLPVSFRIAPTTLEYQKKILRSKRIESIECNLQEFVDTAKEQVEPYDIRTSFLERVKSNVPRDLAAAFESNATATTKLLKSWEYVNAAKFDQAANVLTFFKGDRPNWGLVGRSIPFERDIQDDLYDEVLDYASSMSSRARCVVLLGPAGYGVTTLLMHIAAQIVKEGGVPVFKLQEGRTPLISDLQFAISQFSERLVFIIDNASSMGSELADILHRLRDIEQPALLLLGSRLNEWRQCYKKPRGHEYLIEPLSDPEIERLLSCLEVNDALGELSGLDRELQHTVIREKHGKELLVTLREATEGRLFDVIIEEEYLRIDSDIGRRTYSIVSSTYQYGIPVREQLLINLLGIKADVFYKEIDRTTEGVLFSDCVDEWNCLNALRARHRVIAKIVWQKCVVGDADHILIALLDSINLNYPLDNKAFEKLYRSEDVVDAISTVDGRIEFFEKACKKDPDSPYIRQHYARMLLREQMFDRAIVQIDKALEMKPNARVLYHTKGLILQDQALACGSIEIGRRILSRSERCYRSAISLDNRDSYGWNGLADLFRRWAKRAILDTEKAQYISKAEEVITEGLLEARDREHLLVQSAEIAKFVGNEPKYFRALEQAVRENPGSIFASYILGRAHLKAGNPKKAITVLQDSIYNDPSAYRSVIVYSKALLNSGHSLDEVISVLRIADLYGLTDPEYIALLGGCLFLNGAFTKAKEVFSECTKRGFGAEEQRRIYFYPNNPANLSEPCILSGQVIKVRAGYSLIQVSEYPDPFLCPGSKYGGLVLESEMKVSFHLVFTAKRPLAVDPKCLSD